MGRRCFDHTAALPTNQIKANERPIRIDKSNDKAGRQAVQAVRQRSDAANTTASQPANQRTFAALSIIHRVVRRSFVRSVDVASSFCDCCDDTVSTLFFSSARAHSSVRRLPANSLGVHTCNYTNLLTVNVRTAVENGAESSCNYTRYPLFTRFRM